MKISLLTIGKTDSKYLREGIADYTNRIGHFISFEIRELPDIKQTSGMSAAHILQKETVLLEKHLTGMDRIVLLDEKGKSFTSRGFSDWLEKTQNSGIRQLAFLVGGAYGFSDNIRERSNESISLSKMTFTHQMVRLFFTEQLYRALTILKGMKYHND